MMLTAVGPDVHRSRRDGQNASFVPVAYPIPENCEFDSDEA
jgi:hypothetical protein